MRGPGNVWQKRRAPNLLGVCPKQVWDSDRAMTRGCLLAVSLGYVGGQPLPGKDRLEASEAL